MGTGVQQIESAFRTRMRAARNQLGMSQQVLAAKLSERGVTMDASAITRLEGGSRAIRLGEAAAIAEVLGFSMDLNRDGRADISIAADELDRLAHEMLRTTKLLRE